MSPDGRTSPVAMTLLEIVRTQPGIHFRALERAADLRSAGQLRHHVDRLLHRGRLVEVPDGGYTRYFVANEHDRRLRPRLARFARPIPRRIGILLLERSLSRTELRRGLRCADSTLGYYLKRMERDGDIAKQRGPTGCRYALVDPAALREVLKVPRPVLGTLRSAPGAQPAPPSATTHSSSPVRGPAPMQETRRTPVRKGLVRH